MQMDFIPQFCGVPIALSIKAKSTSNDKFLKLLGRSPVVYFLLEKNGDAPGCSSYFLQSLSHSDSFGPDICFDRSCSKTIDCDSLNPETDGEDFN
ncbi:hypothetical protein CEXT_122921 [Caerostris extrusa]|uniref:Uncharacterized protein n=1 Tax=Caerostris extrusa TaxID=172846 RepID=A0AAV4WC89_CAEEX|nr:hypothetical protein CEXT_122921 [Caerostris extrusa]